MIIAALTLYSLSVFVHVTAVVVGLGSTFAESLMFPVALRVGHRHLPYLHRLQLAINRWLATPALAIVLLTGIYQVAAGPWRFGDLWISASFAIVIALGALLGGYFIPSDRRLGPLVEQELAYSRGTEPELSDEYLRQARRQGIAGAVAGVLVVLAIFLMVVKPGA